MQIIFHYDVDITLNFIKHNFHIAQHIARAQLQSFETSTCVTHISSHNLTHDPKSNKFPPTTLASGPPFSCYVSVGMREK